MLKLPFNLLTVVKQQGSSYRKKKQHHRLEKIERQIIMKIEELLFYLSLLDPKKNPFLKWQGFHKPSRNE
jgi:hypothetical protein